MAALYISRPLQDRTDDQLVNALRNGDGLALTELMYRYHAELAAYLLRWTRRSSLVEDILQDVFFRLWRTRSDITVPEGIRAYLYVAVRSRTLDILRAERRSHAREARAIQEPNESVTDPEAALLQQADADAVLQVIKAAVASLPQGAQDVWCLCKEQGLTHTEAAASLGVSTGTIKTQLHRASKVVRAAVMHATRVNRSDLGGVVSSDAAKRS